MRTSQGNELFEITHLVRGPKALFRVNLALASIQCFFIDSIAPESPDSKSAGCKAVTFGEIELFMF